MRVLIVDGYPDAADSLAELLALYGHTTQAASDAGTARTLAHTFRPEVVICDPIGEAEEQEFVLSPRSWEGAEFADVRFIALTTLHGSGAEARLRACGFERCLLKPVPWEQLEQALTRTSGPASSTAVGSAVG